MTLIRSLAATATRYLQLDDSFKYIEGRSTELFKAKNNCIFRGDCPSIVRKDSPVCGDVLNKFRRFLLLFTCRKSAKPERAFHPKVPPIMSNYTKLGTSNRGDDYLNDASSTTTTTNSSRRQKCRTYALISFGACIAGIFFAIMQTIEMHAYNSSEPLGYSTLPKGIVRPKTTLHTGVKVQGSNA